MPKRARERSAYELRRIKTPGFYAVGRVAGLYLRYRSPRAIYWLLRGTLHGEVREFGVGSYPEISLEAAREIATHYRAQIRQGIDPKAEERKVVASRKAEELTLLTFEQAAEACWQAKSKEFNNAKHSLQWIKTLREHAYPVLGDLYVQDIQRAHVLKVLQPIWETITDTACKLRGRIETVISYAYALREITDRKNPAAWTDGLDALLPSAKSLIAKKDKHYPAIPWQRLPVFMQRLASKSGTAARALEFQIQLAGRGLEVRGACWSEINWQKKEWQIPATRMKNKRVHRVPLTDDQLCFLDSLPRFENCDLIFPNSKGAVMNDAIPGNVIRDLHAADVAAAKKAGLTQEQIQAEIMAGNLGFYDPAEKKVASPHGTARSSFKDWVRSNVAHRYGDEVSELCLAHVNSDITRAAYARDELIDLRRQMLDEWARYLRTPAASGNVIPLVKRSIQHAA